MSVQIFMYHSIFESIRNCATNWGSRFRNLLERVTMFLTQHAAARVSGIKSENLYWRPPSVIYTHLHVAVFSLLFSVYSTFFGCMKMTFKSVGFLVADVLFVILASCFYREPLVYVNFTGTSTELKRHYNPRSKFKSKKLRMMIWYIHMFIYIYTHIHIHVYKSSCSFYWIQKSSWIV